MPAVALVLLSWFLAIWVKVTLYTFGGLFLHAKGKDAKSMLRSSTTKDKTF